MHYLSHNFCTSEFLIPLNSTFCSGSPKAAIQVSARLCPHLRLNKRRICFQVHLGGRIHFLVSVEFMAAFFSKANDGERESLLLPDSNTETLV